VTAAEPITYRKPLRDRDVLFPANMGVALRVFDRVGGFDENPLLNWAAEDNDWAYRALRGGVPIVYDPTRAWSSGTSRGGRRPKYRRPTAATRSAKALLRQAHPARGPFPGPPRGAGSRPGPVAGDTGRVVRQR
jgi:GT2 family glycosyltransferase